MAMRTKIKVRLLQQATKINRKPMKIVMFFGTSILIRFGKGLRLVLVVKIKYFPHFFDVFSKRILKGVRRARKWRIDCLPGGDREIGPPTAERARATGRGRGGDLYSCTAVPLHALRHKASADYHIQFCNG